MANQITRYRKMKPSNAGPFEVYHNSPENSAPAGLRVDVFLPLKG